jgi:hypothetical protein
MKLKIWHGIRHEGSAVTEIEVEISGDLWVMWVKEQGGFWYEGGFTPWHRINYIEEID